jgi:hypothetical protein
MVPVYRMNEHLNQAVQDLVDDLQPLLTPYQTIFYLYLFRHSHLKTGAPLIRVSTTGLQYIVQSRCGPKMALTHVRYTLADLVKIGAIRKEGESNRQGTPYSVLLPQEIQACLDFRARRTAPPALPEVSPSEMDYYNVRENRVKVFDRDAYKCRYCDKQLTQATATLDHVMPVSSGGGNTLDNLVTACLVCNSRKYKRPLGDFLAEQ